MKNISEFEKLFKLNFPVRENYEYYIDTLMKSPFYAGLGKLVEEFEKYEKDIEEEGLFKSPTSYKLDYALPKLKSYIMSTKAYIGFISDKLDNSKLRTKDELRNNDNTYLISIDFKSANYNAIKTYDNDGELFDSWEELCMALDIHPTLSKSKSFRQYVFGNLSPKRLQTHQHFCISKIVNKLLENGFFEEDDFVFISHDEFVIRLRPDHKLAVNRIHILNSEVGRIISEENIDMLTHYNVFKLETLGKGKYIKTHYNVKMGGLSEKYTSLVGVPGNEFFKYFKTNILKKELDDRDLLFIVDKKLARWVI